MAIFYPAQLPESVLRNKKLQGEIDVFNALSNLPDEYEVFYNRNTRRGGVRRVMERPIDFIVLHERLGLLAIEVKGGRLRFGEGEKFEHYYKGQWNYSNPYQQVKLALIDLINTAKADGADYWIPDNFCIAFPHTSRFDLIKDGTSLPDGLLCREDVPVIATLIPKLFSKSHNDAAWTRENFLDMRRRLQNMPEGRRGGFIKTTQAVKNFIKPVMRAEKIEEREKAEAATPYRKPSPFPYPEPAIFSAPIPLEKHLKWWEILIAIAVLIAAFVTVSLLFPNSYIYELISQY